MGLDITIHRKGVKWGSDYHYNGRYAYREVMDFMKNKYYYSGGFDYPLTFLICEELKVVIIQTMTDNINDDMKMNKLKNMFYDITNVQINMETTGTKWYFEATW